MEALKTKKQILRDAGYSYNFDREIYVNRKTKRVFSVEFIDDNSESVLEEHVRGGSTTGEWEFFFNSEPSDSVKRDLRNALG